MSGPGRFGAVVTAMVTPFDEAGGLDVDGAVTLARWLAEHGNDGLVVTGTTGESPTLTDAEKKDLWKAVAEAVTIPVVAGCTTNDTAHSVELTKAAAACGVAGVLAVTPYYSRPSQAGLDAHFRAVADAAGDLPVLLYDIPVRTGRKIAHDTLVGLLGVRNIVGVKDAAADPYATARLLAAAPGAEVYSGDDGLTLPLVAVGACGAVSVASHWTGRLQQHLFEAFWKGDVARAAELNQRLLPSFVFETGDDAPNPIPTKAVLRALGLPGGQARLPLGPCPPHVDEAARRLVEQLRADI